MLFGLLPCIALAALHLIRVTDHKMTITSGRIQFGAGGISASGGDTITTNDGWIIHSFTTVGTTNFTVVGSGALTCEVFVVAGGGAGGGASEGGGGGGGGIVGSCITVGVETVTVTVGSGGESTANGSNSVFGPFTALGGGAGGRATVGAAGGCGGGGGYLDNVGGAGSQGGNGGASLYIADEGDGSFGDGGGGGAKPENGQVGLVSEFVAGGKGGDGYTTNISGASVTYAGGGGGHWNLNDSESVGFGAGGSGGGGSDSAGTNGLGGGGSGGYGGGSGIVIVRYKIPGS